MAASLTNGEIARVCGCVATGFEKKTADTMSQDVTSDAQSPRTLASMLKLRELELPTKMLVFLFRPATTNLDYNFFQLG